MKKAKSFLSWKIWRALNRKMSVMTSLFAVLACAFAMMASDPASAQNQVPAKKNLIFIIDDSGSMVPHQNQLAKSATPILVDAFRSGILASVTVITTTSKADAGQNFKISRVIPQNLNLEADLNDALTPGSGGSTGPTHLKVE